MAASLLQSELLTALAESAPFHFLILLNGPCYQYYHYSTGEGEGEGDPGSSERGTTRFPTLYFSKDNGLGSLRSRDRVENVFLNINF